MQQEIPSRLRATGASLLSIVVLFLLLGSPIAQAASWQVISSPSPGTYNYLNGVAALSAKDVWAVGIFSNSSTQTLIEHWNGKSWQVVSSPSPGATDNSLSGVTAVSAANLWTVGLYQNGSSPSQTLIEHWNGTSWKVVSSPNVGTSDNGLSSVAALSATNLWAIGGYAITMGPILTLTEEYS